VFKHIIAGNNLKPFRVRIIYINVSAIGGQGTTISLKKNEADDNETDQAKDKAAALKIKEEEIKEKNKIFPNKSYIFKDKIFTVVV
jgi:type IV secretory pathway VirB4 component